MHQLVTVLNKHPFLNIGASLAVALTGVVVGGGCSGIGLDEMGPGESGVVDGIQISSIDPYYGPTSGNTTVTITGEGFDSDIEVMFGNAELDFTRITEDSIVVTTPFLGFESAVDVTVLDGVSEDTWIDGFTFTDGPPPDPPDTGGTYDTGNTGSSVDGTGLTGGLIEMSLLQIACPDCFGVSSSIVVSASAAFHAPVAESWVDWLPTSGSCQANPTVSGPNVTMVDVGEWVYLNSGSRSLGLRRNSGDSGVTYQASDLGETDFVRTAHYDVQVPESTGRDISDALLTPQGWSTIEPSSILLTSPMSAFSAPISRQGQTFNWTPYGGSGTFLILLTVYNSAGTNTLGTVLCRGEDNGSLHVPSSFLGGFPRNGLVAITLMRYQVESSTIDSNGSTIEGVASIAVQGTGKIQ